MRKTSLLSLFSFLLLSSGIAFYLSSTPEPVPSGNDKTPGSTYKKRKKNKTGKEQDGPDQVLYQDFLMTRDPVLNAIPFRRLVEAKKKMEEIITTSIVARTGNVLNTTALTWTERGPNNIGGRTRAVVVSSNDPTGNTVFAGSVGGGLWKTTNFKSATPTWNVVNDFFANIAITCIKQSPVNPSILYFGTGEGWGNADAIQGLGIWKSADGGTTWNQLSATSNISYVHDLEFDGNGYIYATTRTTNAAQRGVLRSADGGVTWVQVLTDPSTSITRGADLERGSNGDMYATLGIFTTGHVYRSPASGTNTGIPGSWTEITPPGIITNGYQRTEIAVSASSNRIYTIAQNGSNSSVGAMYRSDNFGGTWTALANATWCDQGSTSSNTDFSRGQAWYDLALAVDPSDNKTVFAGGVVLEKTTNSGSAWTQATRWTNAATCTTVPVIHADIHDIIFMNSNELIVATDGGIYYSADGGATFQAKNNGYNVTQYYSAAISPVASSHTMLAGAQDNGTHLFTLPGVNTVSSVSGGDGGFCFIDQTDPTVWITGYTNSYFNIFRTNGLYAGSVSNASGRFINPADYDNTLNILYHGEDNGYFGRISNVESGSISATVIDVSAAMGTRQISAVKVDPNTTTTVWFGCSSSSYAGGSVVPVLVKVTGANTASPTATQFAGPALSAGSYISSIDIDASNSSHMLLTVSNYGVASVWESTDGGASWTSLDNNGVNLPDMPVRWGIFIPAGYSIGPGTTTNGIMLATELGVWSTLNTSGSTTAWTNNNAGLANVRVDMLKLRTSDKTIVAATHGRGLYTATIATALPVTLINFTGQALDGFNQLNWSTAMEQNIRHFEVEKSLNGADWFVIGRATAAGMSSSRRDYLTRDDKVSSSNYYRLKIIEESGYATYSNIVLIQAPDNRQNLWVLNNPFNDNLQIRFASKASRVKLMLTSMSGAVVAQREYINPPLQITWQLGEPVGRGTYVLAAFVDGKLVSRKVVRN